MLKKVWKNRIEFYPYLVILLFWFGSAFTPSLVVQNRPGIIALGAITIPSMVLVIIAIVKTYESLPDSGKLPGPKDMI